MDFLQNHPLYVVGIIATVIWVGIFIFMIRLDGRVRKLEKKQALNVQAAFLKFNCPMIMLPIMIIAPANSPVLSLSLIQR